jgi:hypothetical protein
MSRPIVPTSTGRRGRRLAAGCGRIVGGGLIVVDLRADHRGVLGRLFGDHLAPRRVLRMEPLAAGQGLVQLPGPRAGGDRRAVADQCRATKIEDVESSTNHRDDLGTPSPHCPLAVQNEWSPAKPLNVGRFRVEGLGCSPYLIVYLRASIAHSDVMERQTNGFVKPARSSLWSTPKTI